jgi:hypothetical protein
MLIKTLDFQENMTEWTSIWKYIYLRLTGIAHKIVRHNVVQLASVDLIANILSKLKHFA